MLRFQDIGDLIPEDEVDDDTVHKKCARHNLRQESWRVPLDNAKQNHPSKDRCRENNGYVVTFVDYESSNQVQKEHNDRNYEEGKR